MQLTHGWAQTTKRKCDVFASPRETAFACGHSQSSEHVSERTNAYLCLSAEGGREEYRGQAAQQIGAQIRLALALRNNARSARITESGEASEAKLSPASLHV
jgi:hypothetical protein